MPGVFANPFTIACDMDDVLMVPHTYIIFSKCLGIEDKLSLPLKEYKAGRMDYESLWIEWHNILKTKSNREKENAAQKVADSIACKTYEFVEKSKKLGKFIIVSNNDGDLVKAVSAKLGVDYVAANKFIFEYKLSTQKKSEALRVKNININTAITDDPVNESDFLDFPVNKHAGIIFKKNDIPDSFYNGYLNNYRIAGSFEEVYEHIIQIKSLQ